MQNRQPKGSLTFVIVCHCKVVSDRQVKSAIADGAKSLSAVCMATGAARECGGCIFTLKAMVCEHHLQESSLVEVEGAAS